MSQMSKSECAKHKPKKKRVCWVACKFNKSLNIHLNLTSSFTHAHTEWTFLTGKFVFMT